MLNRATVKIKGIVILLYIVVYTYAYIVSTLYFKINSIQHNVFNKVMSWLDSLSLQT